MNTTLSVECSSCEGPLEFEIADFGSPECPPRPCMNPDHPAYSDPGDPGSPPTIEGPTLCPNRLYADDDMTEATGRVCGHDLRRDTKFQAMLVKEAERRIQDWADAAAEDAAEARADERWER